MEKSSGVSMVVRKLSIGTDYKNCMNYVAGQLVLGGTHKVFEIIEEAESVSIFIENDKKEVVIWKKIGKTTPHTIEYNIDYEITSQFFSKSGRG